MKYIKLSILLAIVGIFAGCSDDESFNTSSATIGFTSDLLMLKENSGMVNIPIEIKGRINGDIKLVITATGKGSNPAEENKNYLITEKNLTLLAVNDTSETAVLNVELKTLDDAEINENREFTISIVSCNGATVSRKSIDVTLRDNDAAFFEKFFGTWTLTGTVQGQNGVSNLENKVITISGPTDESDPSYDKFLTVSAPKMVNVGADLDFTWRFAYTFDKDTKQGTLSLIMDETVSKFGSSYSWKFKSYINGQPSTENYVTTWSLDNNALPKTIQLFPDKSILFYGGTAADPGIWRIFKFTSMTRK